MGAQADHIAQEKSSWPSETERCLGSATVDEAASSNFYTSFSACFSVAAGYSAGASAAGMGAFSIQR